MEMEDHHHHHHHHHQYGSAMADLRQLMNGRTTAHLIPSNNNNNFPPTAAGDQHHHHNLFSAVSISPPPPPQPAPFEMMMMGRPISAVEIMPRGTLFPHHHQHPHGHPNHHHHEFRSDNSTGNSTASMMTATTNSAPSTLSSGCGLEAETMGGDGGTGRWPRQETLTLLEIRSRLDSKFKEANQKGPLWDEVSRIMSEEHGYQRSGKKCREKFENLYKYYKKTKEGKAGRQDGKHYRFFRQLEALYGETSNQNSIPDQTQYISNNFQFLSNTTTNPSSTAHHQPIHQDQLLAYNNNQSHNSLSLSNSSEFESSSSDDNDSSEKRRNRRGGSRGWKVKIKEFIDSQMRKLMEKQEAWLEKLMKTLEQKENERSLREEEWRKQEAARIDKEHKFWAKERAWIEARDSALLEALKNLTGKEIDYKAIVRSSPDQGLNNNDNNNNSNMFGGDSLDGQDHDQDESDDGKGDNHQNNWLQSEITRLIQLRTSMDSRFSEGGFSEEVLWEDIAAKMACLGYDRSGLMCKEKWESVNDYMMKKSNKELSSGSSKKRKENSRGCSVYNMNESSTPLYNHGGFNCHDQMNDGTTTTANSSPSPSNANVGTSSGVHHHDGCFPAFLIGEGTENLWENYGLKINKGGQNQ